MAEMASANVEHSTTAESPAVNNSSPETAAQLLLTENDGKENLSIKVLETETEDVSDHGKLKRIHQDEQEYLELLAQKELLEVELQAIIDGLQPLRIQLEELDKSIAKDEAELPVLEAMMMDEVREFLATSPKYTKLRPGV